MAAPVPHPKPEHLSLQQCQITFWAALQGDHRLHSSVALTMGSFSEHLEVSTALSGQ